MWILIVSLIVLGLFSALLSLPWHNKDGDDTVINAGTDCSTCNGDNAKCEQTCMMEAATKEVEYFDDEELDRFRERPSAAYRDEEAEEFREVLYTMRPEEVRAWTRSLTLRGISLPDQVKDEVFVLLEP
ncbi:MAG: hypothetical protein II612_00435 [Prevotella sp.]|nr:hypothetical protein [Prevotella sp.]